MSFEIAVVSEKRRFEVLTVNERRNSVARFKSSTVVRIRRESDENTDEEEEQNDVFDGKLELVGVPAFEKQSERLNLFFEAFRNPFYLTKFQQLLPDYVESGVVIHGSSGSGKSFILCRIAALNWGRVSRIKRSDKLSAMQEILAQARAQQPSIVLIDDFEKTIADRPNRTAIIDFMCETLDEIAAEAVCNGALPKVVMVFTCKDFLSDMPEELRPRISTHIPLPIPDQKGRLEILQYYNLALPPDSRDDVLLGISQRTHAFNPRDLFQLVKRASANANVRITKAGGLAEDATSGVEREDLEDALRHTKPSGMHDINLKPPTVQWKDIGGQGHVKKALQQMIRRTMVS
jgi:AAA family ATPase